MLEIANPSLAEIAEIERQVDYVQSREVTKATAASVARVRAAIQVVEANRLRAVAAKAGLFNTAIEQSFTQDGIGVDLTQVAGLDAAIQLYQRGVAHLTAVHLADALVEHAAAAEREAEALLRYEKSRREAQEHRLLEDFSRVRTGGVEFSTDTALLLAAWTENIRRAEILVEDARRTHRDAQAARIAQRQKYSEMYGEN